MSNPQLIKIALFANKDNQKSQNASKSSLFEALNKKIEEHSKTIKSRSASTISPHDSDDEIDKILLENSDKIFRCKNFSSSCPESFTTHILCQLLASDDQHDIIVEKIKNNGREQATKLNIRFEYLTKDTTISLSKEPSALELIKQFDTCFDMIECLQTVYYEMKTLVQGLQIEEKGKEFLQEYDNVTLYEMFIKEFLDNCPTAKTLCKVIQTFLTTSLFENESEEVLESILYFSYLSKQSKSSSQDFFKSPVFDYKTLINRIDALSINTDRLPLQFSESFMESIKRKSCKAKTKAKKCK